MNNNWIVGNWFKTWPTRDKIAIKDTLSVTSHVYNEYLKNNIISLDVIGCPDESTCLLSTVKTYFLQTEVDKISLSEMNVDVIPANHNSVKNVSMDSVLKSLPIIYNPSTKQLHIIKAKSVINDSSSLLNDQDRPSFCQQLTKLDNQNKDIDQSEESVALLSSYVEKDIEPCSSCLSNPETEETTCDPKSQEVLPTHFGPNESPYNNVHSSSTITYNTESYAEEGSLTSSATNLSSLSATDSAIWLRPEDSVSLSGEPNCSKKKKGLVDFFNRNLFSWMHKDDSVSSNALDSDKNSPSRSSVDSAVSVEGLSSSSCRPAWSLLSRENPEKTLDLEAGSVGLIMECRPGNLPAKAAGEEERHKQEYENIVVAAKRKEVKEAKEKRKAQASQLKIERQLREAVRTWNTTILPKWNTMHNHKKCQELWWAGIPSCVRGSVWKLAIGNELHLTASLYTILVQRSLEKLVSISQRGSMADLQEDATGENPPSQESTLDLIRLDVSRTFPHLCIFQKGGPFHDTLHNILGAYVCYRPDVGYVQGMSFIAATLLLNMDESDAFISFANLLSRPTHMAFFSFNQLMMHAYYKAFEELLRLNLPQLNSHLEKLNVSPDMYFLEWILTVFARSLPLDVAARIWDVYLRDGEEFLFRAAVGILKHYEMELLGQECTAMTAQFLTRLPEDLSADSLFKVILSVQVTVNKRTLKSILHFYINENSDENAV